MCKRIQQPWIFLIWLVAYSWMHCANCAKMRHSFSQGVRCRKTVHNSRVISVVASIDHIAIRELRAAVPKRRAATYLVRSPPMRYAYILKCPIGQADQSIFDKDATAHGTRRALGGDGDINNRFNFKCSCLWVCQRNLRMRKFECEYKCGLFASDFIECNIAAG